MKNKIIVLVLLLFASSAMISCEDILNTEAADAFAEDLIYDDPAQVERLLYTVYNSTESWGLNKRQWWSRRFNIEGASFEAKFNFQNRDLFALRGNGWAPNRTGVFTQKWDNYFTYVRSANEFLDRIDASGAMEEDPGTTNMLKAEMKFLRANLYAKLIRFYGGVPIMENALGLNDDFNLVRNSYEECVDFIVKELDEAIPFLPETRSASNFGRATKLSAMAVKSRALLYAASKLHDPSTAPSGPLYDYTKSTKWQDAADAAKAVLDAVGNRDLMPAANADEYQKLFLSTNQDILFGRSYGAAYYDFGTDVNSLPDQTQSPNGFGGWALSSPSHNFAMQFRMADGTHTNGGTFDATNPNDGREMRYYANLNFNGSDFRGRKVEYFLSDDPAAFPNGIDSPKGLGNVQHSSKTGYNIRKFHDQSLGSLTEISVGRPYILYRLAEQYLNYAEAQFQLGNEDEARAALNKVATRALLPEITATGDALLEEIKTERRVELSFEGHSFFDERRWMNEDHLGFDVKGLRWTKDAAGELSFEEYTVVKRPWYAKMYYLPIPRAEVEKAPSILQNDGY